MRDLSSLTASDFEAALGTVFQIALPDGARVPLELAEVRVVGAAEGRPFSLLFRGPLSPVCAQVTHRVVHPVMGEFELFLGPIASDSEHVTYEAVFA
jgi:hypothetical protein